MRAFLATDPNPFIVGAVADWLRSIRENGPPAAGVQVWDDHELHLAVVPRTAWVCRYFVVAHERLVILVGNGTGLGLKLVKQAMEGVVVEFPAKRGL